MFGFGVLECTIFEFVSVSNCVYVTIEIVVAMFFLFTLVFGTFYDNSLNMHKVV